MQNGYSLKAYYSLMASLTMGLITQIMGVSIDAQGGLYSMPCSVLAIIYKWLKITYLLEQKLN